MIGTELPNPIVVTVMDTSGGMASAQAVSGQIVNFVVTSGGGSVFAGSGLSNAAGQVQEIWTLGDLVGTQTLEARAVDATTGQAVVFATVSATGIAPPPPPEPPESNHLEWSLSLTDLPEGWTLDSGFTQFDSIAAGIPFDFTAVASVWEEDSAGNKVRDVPFTISGHWAGAPSSASQGCAPWDTATVLTCDLSSNTIPIGSPGYFRGYFEIWLWATDPEGNFWSSAGLDNGRGYFITY